nr:MAG TPA: hypothetical protein [Caudoviricetes sp.]
MFFESNEKRPSYFSFKCSKLILGIKTQRNKKN